MIVKDVFQNVIECHTKSHQLICSKDEGHRKPYLQRFPPFPVKERKTRDVKAIRSGMLTTEYDS